MPKNHRSPEVKKAKMPTNLPPEYFDAERDFRSAESLSAKISCLEELISTIPKHKGTDKLRADLRRKLSKLRSDNQKKKSISRHDSEYHIEKEGSARIVIIGPPNTGKSTLLATLTHATPKISSFPYTTWSPLPGMMSIDEIQLQLIDTPPLNKDYVKPEMFDLIRTANLVLIMIDIQTYPIQQLEDTLAILDNHKIFPRHLGRQNATETSRTGIPFLLAVNKADSESLREDFAVFRELIDRDWPIVCISLTRQDDLTELGHRCFELLELMRIYSKPPGKDPERDQPYVLKKGSTVEAFARLVHRDFQANLKNARVWGQNVYDGQMVGRDHILHDADIVELHL